MTALAEDRTPGPLRLELAGLWLTIGREGGTCFRVHLSPDEAMRLAGDLVANVMVADRAGHQALAELDEITAAYSPETGGHPYSQPEPPGRRPPTMPGDERGEAGTGSHASDPFLRPARNGKGLPE